MGWFDKNGGSVIASAISGVSDIIQGYSNRRWQEEQQQKAWDWQADQQQKAFDWQYMMYEKQKNDNSYASQLKQLQEAGLSPAMMASSSFQPVSQSTAPSMPSSASMPYSSVPYIGDELGKIYDNLLKERQIENMDIQNQYLPKLNESQLDKAEAEIAKLVADKLLSEEQANQIKELLPLLKGKTEAEIDQLKALKDEIDQRCKNLRQDERYAIWKNDFLAKFGFNPEAPGFNALIQALVSGKGATILDSMFNTIKGVFTDSDSVDTVVDSVKNKYDELEQKEYDRLLNRKRKQYERQQKRNAKKKKYYDVYGPTDSNSTYFRNGR